jgi:hypothetical protein
MAKTGIVDLFASVVHEYKNDSSCGRHYLRLCEFEHTKTGAKIQKVGLSRFFFSPDVQRWLPSQKAHCFIPAEALPTLIEALAKLEKQVKEKVSASANGQPVPPRDGVDGHIVQSDEPSGDTTTGGSGGY